LFLIIYFIFISYLFFYLIFGISTSSVKYTPDIVGQQSDDFLWKAHYSQRYKMFEFQLDAHQGSRDEDPTTTTTTTALPCYDTWKAFFASRVVAQLPFHGALVPPVCLVLAQAGETLMILH
jgi:hypothetical protein